MAILYVSFQQNRQNFLQILMKIAQNSDYV
jgi:hypothetical protein